MAYLYSVYECAWNPLIIEYSRIEHQAFSRISLTYILKSLHFQKEASKTGNTWKNAFPPNSSLDWHFIRITVYVHLISPSFARVVTVHTSKFRCNFDSHMKFYGRRWHFELVIYFSFSFHFQIAFMIAACEAPSKDVFIGMLIIIIELAQFVSWTSKGCCG